MRRILFIHHSTGANLLKQGRIREKLSAKKSEIELWDHGYNFYPAIGKLVSKLLPTSHTGLSDGTGAMQGVDYKLEISNADIGSYLTIFDQSHPSMSKVLEFEGVIFKMCYPSTKIESEDHLAEIKAKYAKLADNLSLFSETRFGLFTPPPLRLELTTSESAQRAVQLHEWMLSNLQGRNLNLFDFFGILADSDRSSPNFGTLRREYCRIIWKDSHPNKRANLVAADKFVDFITQL